MRRLGLAAAFALGLALSFPFRAGTVHFDFGLVAGWLALVPLALLLRGLAPGPAFRWSTGAALAGFCAVIPWLFVVVYRHGHAPAWVAVLAVVGMALYLALHAGLAGALTAWLEPRAGPLAVAVLPAAWVVGEWLRTRDVANGFPWAFLGYSVHRNGPLLELAGIGGVYGLSFLLALAASLAARRRFTLALALMAAAHVGGFALRLGARVEPEERPLHAGLVQASIPQEQKWDPALAREAFDAHLRQSRLALAAGELDLLVWPEASAPVLLQVQPDWAADLGALAREADAALLVGGMGIEPIPASRDWRYFNSLFLLSPGGDFEARYDKAVLVPFGEYVPWRSVWGSLLEGLATGLASGDVTPGAGARTIEVAGRPLAPLICYEVLYPSYVRQAARRGARLLVNVTNDAWYGRSSAPHQFLAMAAMRAAEHGLPMLRAANTGVSAVIDAGGVVLRETGIFEPAALRARVPGARVGATLYTRLGDWVVWGSLVLLVGLGGTRLVGRGREGARDAGADPDAR